jgi:hypothetical protein
VDPVVQLPRLFSVIPKDYAVYIEDEKISFDFMISTSLLAGILSLAILLAGLIYPDEILESPITVAGWLAEIVVFGLASILFYHWSISRAAARGDYVRSEFDLYRSELLEKMGHRQVPDDKIKGKRTVEEDHPTNCLLGPSRSTGRAEGGLCRQSPTPGGERRACGDQIGNNPEHRDLVDGAGTLVVVEVKNPDPEQTAKKVIVTERMPDGHAYVWPSAWVDDNSQATVSGMNPYHSSIGCVNPGEKKTLIIAFFLKGKAQATK